MRISDWSSDVCSSDLFQPVPYGRKIIAVPGALRKIDRPCPSYRIAPCVPGQESDLGRRQAIANDIMQKEIVEFVRAHLAFRALRSEENKSELQSLMRTSYAVFRLKKKYSTSEEHTYVLSSHNRRTKTIFT